MSREPMTMQNGPWNFNKYGQRMCGAVTRQHSTCTEPIDPTRERCRKCHTRYSAYERANPRANMVQP